MPDFSQGICKLCGEYKTLRKSHFIPKGFYPKDLKKLEYATRRAAGIHSRHVKQYLLCNSCEEKFNKNGESYVIKLIRPNETDFPIRDKIASATSPESDGVSVVSAPTIGVDTDKFAYFMLSVVWRASVKQWRLPDRSLSNLLDPGEYQEPIRKFLNGETKFPDNMIVIVSVGTDQYSRDRWFAPAPLTEHGLKTVSLLTRGVFFRLLMGEKIVTQLGDYCCVTSPSKNLFLADGEKKVSRTFANMPFLIRIPKFRHRKNTTSFIS
jgi:hypothetical protein